MFFPPKPVLVGWFYSCFQGSLVRIVGTASIQGHLSMNIHVLSFMQSFYLESY